MALTTQRMFSHRDLLEMLVKRAGLHKGRHQLVIAFAFGASNFKDNEGKAMPAATALVAGVGLMEAQPDSPDDLVIDAAEVNPAP